MSFWHCRTQCPRCGDEITPSTRRIRRKLWMRLLPRTRYYNCDRCNSKYLLLCNCIPLHLG